MGTRLRETMRFLLGFCDVSTKCADGLLEVLGAKKRIPKMLSRVSLLDSPFPVTDDSQPQIFRRCQVFFGHFRKNSRWPVQRRAGEVEDDWWSYDLNFHNSK